ncbi:DNA gyrase inhibitor YacG [Pelagibacterium luteolum]|uniref:DNA gyrase inhibitor YacG n=1 Tax=Pelagibacterium luteolum TaxID=440168 RepID=A0A1G7Y5U0_9HYPH|nr:DNA gyrase inhibitor YacG [Pelagibacterium luteolum]SDG91811.1 hypothetical protein SAMN04487974_11272 [Pelagibacterium luteolum]
MPDNVTRLRQPKPCPICGKLSVQQFHPFCSARCADVDLNRWLKGNYAIPGNPVETDPEGDGFDMPGEEDN